MKREEWGEKREEGRGAKADFCILETREAKVDDSSAFWRFGKRAKLCILFQGLGLSL